MPNIRLLIFLALMPLFSINADAAARGEKSVGVKIGYCSRNESPVGGLYFQYDFSRHFRLSPSIDYIFRHEGYDGFTFNLTAQFPIGLRSSRFDIYPLAGLSYAIWNHTLPKVAGNDVSERINRLGLDVGAGAEYKISSSLKLFVQGKFNWVKNFNTGIFVAGIGYVF